MTARLLVPAALSLVLLACDNAERKEQFVNVEKKEEKDPAEEKRMEERKAKRIADEKAKSDAAEAKRELLIKIAVVPDKLEKKLDKACNEVGAAHERFMRRLHTGEVLEKWLATKDDQLPMTIVQCASAASVEVAGCQASALDNAPPELKEDVPEILSVCIDKFGAKAPPAGAGPGGAGQIPPRPK
jgi:hypothetical protein